MRTNCARGGSSDVRGCAPPRWRLSMRRVRRPRPTSGRSKLRPSRWPRQARPLPQGGASFGVARLAVHPRSGASRRCGISACRQVEAAACAARVEEGAGHRRAVGFFRAAHPHLEASAGVCPDPHRLCSGRRMTALHSGARRDVARAPSPLQQGRGGLATPAPLSPGGSQLAATDGNAFAPRPPHGEPPSGRHTNASIT